MLVALKSVKEHPRYKIEKSLAVHSEMQDWLLCSISTNIDFKYRLVFLLKHQQTRKSGKMSTVIESLFYCHPFVDKQVFVEVCALSEVLQDELIAMFKSKEQHEYYLLMLTNRLVQCDYK